MLVAAALLSGCSGGWSDADFNGAVQYCAGFGLPNCFERVSIFEEAGCPLGEVYDHVDTLVGFWAEGITETGTVGHLTLDDEREAAEFICSDE